IRHWSQVTGILADGDAPNQLKTTPLGQKLFGRHGWDPYMENPATLWLIHWLMSGRAEKTTWYWAFNYYPNSVFEREHLVKGLEKLVTECRWGKISGSTIKRDVECFVRTYVPKPPSPKTTFEEALESPLTELGLIKPVGKRDGFRFVRGPKSSLGRGVFLFALIDFWKNYSTARTLSFETIAHEPGSPGRVFLLDESDLADRLMQLDQDSKGKFRWSETAGLKQIIRDIDLDLDTAFQFIDEDFQFRHN
ncbi:MAG TPA: DUF4007 family protein, partial [Candidatus Ozemobacteraceae bacterium]|nr:DUF4007 family protein [Candidatus Ozemobacteraceae bacterium]